MSVIEARDVSIRYITGDFKDIGLKEFILRKLTRHYHIQEFWADRGVTFTLEKGDMLGIIGSNGAGKSTLLKAISRIMEPTEGHIAVNGRIAALLELGAGFDDELSVRENTYLRGALLGYTRKFMDDMYSSIIDFAELRDFQERPFKQLSSGMKSRLAFSIACLVHPDIIILDEVLSVGDGAFQRKSSEKMKSIISSGITGILVSHANGQIRELCNKVLWLDHGKQVIFSDQVELCCNAYEEFLCSRNLPQSEDDIHTLSDTYIQRQEDERKANEKDEAEQLTDILSHGSVNAALEAALRFIQNNKPEWVKDNVFEQRDNGESA